MAVTPERRPFLAAGGAVLIVAAAVAAIVILGGVRYPAFSTVAEQPEPAVVGRIAFARWDGNEQCVVVVEQGREPRELTCENHGGFGALGWTADGRLSVERWAGSGEEELVLDPETGDVMDRRLLPPDDGAEPAGVGNSPAWERDDGSRLVTGGTDREAWVELVRSDGEASRLLQVEGPRHYRFDDATFSPDGEWVLITDSEERLLIAPTGGGPTRLLTQDGGTEPVWWQPEP